MVNPDTYDEYFYILEAFNIGFRVQIFFPAARDCTAVARIFLNELNYTSGNQTQENFDADTYNYLRNWTKLVSYQFADAFLYCHMTGVDVYDYYELQTTLYKDWLDWLQAALQNMVGNIIRLNNLYNKMVIATENEDELQVWYIYGRICYYLLDIEPIEDAALGDNDDPYAEPDKPQHATLTDVFRTFNKLMDI